MKQKELTKCLWHLCENKTKNKFCNYKCKCKYHTNENRRRTKKRAIEYKGGKCQRCGYNRCVEALDFHHLDPSQKDFRISNGNNRAWDKT
jgi:hypothetical protein